MKNLKLQAVLREETKVDKTFKRIPAILYGPEMKESKKVWVDFQKFVKVFDEAGESTLIDLEIEGEKNSYSVLVHDAQYHPISGKYQHVDFYKVKADKKIETSVELEFIGESPAVKGKGGILVKNLDEVEIRCLPKDLISEIKVDISVLKELEDAIHLDELNVPDAVELLSEPRTVVVSVMAPRSQEEIDKLNEKVEMDIDQVEGIKGKDDEVVAEGGKDEKKDKKKE